ncbi:LacI family DNA-binding transcriptional regulator [Microbacterium cremeum]|uniref:LacI family DNA-binding transcriptional regulator n=1 Tax=Microbacterium cremeum TaxID=2782169 RepID=UPI001888D1FA|nr:LacI family DNA-binding transcriptional regulator [Microbacterium cremeum]
MKDIAEHVGMSRQLVSIVLRNAQGASEASRQRVIEAARELGYYPDESARLLRQRRSGQLGVLFTMRQPFEVDLVDALYGQAADYGYRLVLSTVGLGRSEGTALDELMRQRIEALIVLTTESRDGIIRRLPSGVPIVLLGGPQATGRHDEVHVENGQGMALAVRHLVELGHSRITYVGPFAGPNAAERLEGYKTSMRSQGLHHAIDAIEADYTEEAGYAAAQELLHRDSRSSALVCANDRCAFGVMETFLREGVRVPEDISIVGFDDSTVARLPFVDLTSVQPNPELMARLGLEAAARRLADPDHSDWYRSVPPTLVVRGSSSAPPSGRDFGLRRTT